MKNILLFLAIAETIFIVMFANYNQISDLKLEIMYLNTSFSMSFFAFCIILYALGIIAGVLIMLKAVLDGAKINKNVKRKLEVTSVDKDENELKIKTLQNKIETLEIALDKALGKNQN